MWPGFDAAVDAICWLSLLLVSPLLWEVFFLVIVRDSKRGTGLLGSLRKDIFERCTSTGSGLFFLLGQ